jgi:hypothetical protein
MTRYIYNTRNDSPIPVKPIYRAEQSNSPEHDSGTTGPFNVRNRRRSGNRENLNKSEISGRLNEEDDRRKGNVLAKTVIVGDYIVYIIKHLEPAKLQHART